MDILDLISEKYNYIFNTLADPRVQKWWLMEGPGPILAITASYLYFCLHLGPRIMKHRKPFDLRNVVMIYNIFQILLSLFLVYKGIVIMLTKQYNFACEPIDYSDTPRGIYIAEGHWWYFFVKVTELIDTIFFVLRKKSQQVSFLHVYHHTLMCIVTWFGIKYTPGGHAIVLGTLNSFVHIIMYTYYFISGLGPEYQKYVWWKKHVTLIQLIQFSLILYHNTSPLFTDCAYPRILNIAASFNASLFIYLFGKFYIKSYNKKNSKKTKLGLKNGSVKGESKRSVSEMASEFSK